MTPSSFKPEVSGSDYNINTAWTMTWATKGRGGLETHPIRHIAFLVGHKDRQLVPDVIC